MAEKTKSNPQGLDQREWVEVRYHHVRNGSGSTRMHLDELPGWIDRSWDTGSCVVVERIVRL